jgi:heat shock protein HslJ
MLRRFFIAIAAAAFLAGCAGEPGAREDPLAGTGWLLDALNGGPVLAEATVTLNFGADGRLSGSDGCNQYSTTYTLSGSSLTVSEPIATTRMACPDAIMQQGSAYLEALGKVASYQKQGDKLNLAGADGAALATFSAQSTDLGGTSWDVISYNNGAQAVVSVMAGTQLTADFGPDGELTGFAGCNDYNSSYVTSGRDKIGFGPVASTRKFCGEPEGVMDQETQYLAALATAATYRIDGDKLEFRTADGAIAASFAKAGP